MWVCINLFDVLGVMGAKEGRRTSLSVHLPEAASVVKDVAQPIHGLPSIPEALSSIPSNDKPGMVAHTCNPST